MQILHDVIFSSLINTLKLLTTSSKSCALIEINKLPKRTLCRHSATGDLLRWPIRYVHHKIHEVMYTFRGWTTDFKINFNNLISLFKCESNTTNSL